LQPRNHSCCKPSRFPLTATRFPRFTKSVWMNSSAWTQFATLRHDRRTRLAWRQPVQSDRRGSCRAWLKTKQLLRRFFRQVWNISVVLTVHFDSPYRIPDKHSVDVQVSHHTHSNGMPSGYVYSGQHSVPSLSNS